MLLLDSESVPTRLGRHRCRHAWESLRSRGLRVPEWSHAANEGNAVRTWISSVYPEKMHLFRAFHWDCPFHPALSARVVQNTCFRGICKRVWRTILPALRARAGTTFSHTLRSRSSCWGRYHMVLCVSCSLTTASVTRPRSCPAYMLAQYFESIFFNTFCFFVAFDMKLFAGFCIEMSLCF